MIKPFLLFLLLILLPLAACAKGPTLPAIRYAFVSNAADGSVSILDLAQDRVAGAVKFGDKGAHGIAASPDGRYGYAALEGVNEVVVIDGEARQVVARIPISFSKGMAQHGVDISPDGKYLWVGARPGGEVRGEVVLAELAIINTGTRQVEEIVQTGLGVPAHYAMTPDGKELWVASTTVDLIWVVDTGQRKVVATIPVVPPKADRPEERRAELAGARIIALNEVAISPDGKRAYAVGPVHDLVFVVDVPSRKLVATVKANPNAHGIVVSRDGKEVWTADWAGTVTIIDAQKLQVKETITLGGRPNHIAFSPDGLKAYVTRTGQDPEIGEVMVLDTATRKTVTTLRVGKGPHEISLEDAPPGKYQALPPGQPATSAPPSDSTPISNLTRRDNGEGGVTFSASPAEASYLARKGHPADHWGFVVQLDTHSGDLTSLDITKFAVLKDGKGGQVTPIAWESLSEDSHHRSGFLIFSSKDTGGQPLFAQSPGYLELVLSDVAGVKERVLRWD